MNFGDYYDAHWLGMAAYYRIHRRRFLQTWDFLCSLALPDRGRVIDIGGVGPIAAYLAAYRRWEAAETKQDLRYLLQGVDSDGHDLVLCTETIEHIKDRNSDDIAELEAFNYSGVSCLLRELRRVVTSDGIILLSTPNANSYLTLHKWMAGDVLLMDPLHVREFSMRDLQRVVTEASLQVVKAGTVNSWEADFGGFVAELRRRLVDLEASVDVERGDNILLAARKVS